MHSKIKTNQLSIIKLNNKTYIPYQLHQLPKWFNKYNTEYFNLKGYTYISLDEHYNNNKRRILNIALASFAFSSSR